jgi:glycosyltransferase involved in cell wall biosynthesis
MSGKKFHIAIITTWYPEPGSTSGVFVRDQADALIDAGNKVSIFMFQYVSTGQWLKKKLKGEPLSSWLKGRNTVPYACNFVYFSLTRLASDPVAKQKAAFLKYIDKTFRLYIEQNGKPDIIHHHGVADFCYITDYLSRTFNIPYVITEHSMFIDKMEHFNNYETDKERLEMIRKASVRAAVSNFYRDFNAQLFKVPFITLPNMINNDFANIPLPSFPKKTEIFYFLNIGELARRKRQDILIEAFTKAFKGNSNIQLNIAGNGNLEQELDTLIQKLDMREQIHLLGYKEKNEIIELLDKSHVLVISSEKESFSMAAAESLFRGNPVLTTLCKGPEDFITEQNGLTCEINNVAGMQTKLVEIYKKYPTFNHLQIAKDARDLYSEQGIAARLEALYASVISPA